MITRSLTSKSISMAMPLLSLRQGKSALWISLADRLRSSHGKKTKAGKTRSGSTPASCALRVLGRGENATPVKLLPEWLARIETVSNDLRADLFDAEFYISLTIGPIPEGMDESELEFTGLRHPPDPC